MKQGPGGESLQERLARLRRQGEAAPKKNPEPNARKEPSELRKALPSWAKQRLLQRSVEPESGLSSSVPKTAGMPADLLAAEGEAFHYRRAILPLGHVHGETPLDPEQLHGQALGSELLTWLTGDPALASFPLRGAVFLDTETTGLSGGAGVFVYMVGLARFVPEGIEIWQGFMAGPEQEAALLEEVRLRIAQSSGVVSFFGKSFDRHRLEDKMRLHSIQPPFEKVPHLDLYHPLRRLHGKAYGDARLQTMERHLCGLTRTDDLPGALAPEAWFDFLAGRAHRLEGVFRHNLDDVLSLISLAQWLYGILRRDPDPSDPMVGIREASLCANLRKAGQGALGLERLRALLQGAQKAPLELWLQRGHCAYQMGEFDEAMQSLAHVVQDGAEGPIKVQALVLRSKVHEHKLRDHESALMDTQAGLSLLKKLRAFSGRSSLQGELERRSKRLGPKD